MAAIVGPTAVGVGVGGGVVVGADVQATTRRPATIVAATREGKDLIRSFS
jgi:F0F1-type ATP synthase membrane subunit c/vacuolar-type H+-ATPase subunit K